jgi:hypothetical protein
MKNPAGNWTNHGGILWDVKKNPHFPHQDHMAMSGLQVDMILEWQLDTNGYFQAERVIRWPMLRTLPDDTHASLQRRINRMKVPHRFSLMVSPTHSWRSGVFKSMGTYLFKAIGKRIWK